jgi:GMP synthase-like glutamine amidotransferase
MDKRLLLIRHSPPTHRYSFETFLEGRYECTTAQFSSGAPPESPDRYDAIIVAGGMMSVYDAATIPWLGRERAYLSIALQRGVPFLGICLGAQLLASLSGATVAPTGAYELGYLEVALTDAGRASPFFQGFDERFLAFQWHGDGFQIPASAVRLATSAPGPRGSAWPNQAFSIGTRALGIQFHLEFTEEHVDSMVGEEAAAWPSGDLVDAPERVKGHGDLALRCAASMRALLDNFLAVACRA